MAALGGVSAWQASDAPAAQRDKKLGKISKAGATQQAIEILAALQKLGDEVRATQAGDVVRVCGSDSHCAAQLAPDEVDFMTKHMTEGIASFQAVTEDGACKM